jgi:hypothetical protein
LAKRSGIIVQLLNFGFLAMPSLRVFSLVLSLIASLALLWFTADYTHFHRETALQGQNLASRRADNAVLAIRAEMQVNEKIVADLVAELSKKRLTADQLSDLLKATMLEHTHHLRLGVAYQPFAFDSTRRLQAPCIARKGTELSACRIDDEYDYTAKEYHWYADALAQGSAWSEARYSERDGSLVVDFAMRFTQAGDKNPSGVAVLTLPVSKFEVALQLVDLGRRGYGFIASPTGRLIVHPIKDYTRKQVTIAKVAVAEKSPGLATLSKLGSTGKSGRLDFVSDLTGEQSWLNYRQLSNSGWMVCTVTAKGLLAKNYLAEYHKLISVALALLAVILTGMMTWLIWKEDNFRRRAWVCAGVASACFLATLGVIWIETLGTPFWDINEGRPMTSGSSVARFTKEQTIDSINARQAPPQFIPTGIFVQSAEFISPTNVSVTGYIWQHYTKGVNDNLAKGFVLPEAESAEITPIYDWQQGSEHYMGWSFHVTLRQSFDYSNYPFDWQSIWMRMWPKDFDKNVTLVPDINSYTLMDPSAMPGIEENIVVGGWIPSSSYFEYRFNNYNVNFGVPNYTGQRHFPELYFQFVIQRNFLDPFISHLTPIFLVMLLIFAMLMTISKDARSRDLLGFNAASIIATAAALFFAVLIAHIDIRSRLQTAGIFYLEYFYFITYLIILLVCVNSILFTYEKKLPFIHYEDNLLPKILYWPVVTGLMLGVTLWFFY